MRRMYTRFLTEEKIECLRLRYLSRWRLVIKEPDADAGVIDVTVQSQTFTIADDGL